MVQLTWRIAMLRKHGPRASGMRTPRMVAISRTSADASASTPGSAAAPPLPYASGRDRKVITWEPGPCWTELQEDGALDASAVGERRDDTCHIVGMGSTQDA